MPATLRHPTLALVGLALIALLCVQLLRDAITLEVAAQRAVISVIALVVCDRVVVPLTRAMLHAPDRRTAAPPAPGRELDQEV